MAQFSLTLDLSEFETKLALLKQPQIPVMRALNKSIKSGKTAAVRAMATDLGLKKADVERFVSVSEATPQRLTASVSASAARIPLIKFNARGPEPSLGRGRGVTAKLKGGRQRYPRAFIATMASGHRGVFERRPGVKRLPVKELFGPSAWQAFQKHQPAALARAEEQLGKNLAHEIAFHMSR